MYSQGLVIEMKYVIDSTGISYGFTDIDDIL